jgi:hypothetical protein
MPNFMGEAEQDRWAEMVADRKDRADQRNHLTSALPKIAAEVEAALHDAHLSIPLFFCVPTSGDSLLTYATPNDPANDEWERVQDIVSTIISRTVGIAKLRSSPLSCIAVGMRIGAVDLVPAADHDH